MAEFSCTDCPRHSARGRHYVQGRGNLKAKIFVVGDAPSPKDSDKGAHFLHDASPVFERALAQSELTRADIMCSYLVRCGGGDPRDADVAACAKHLDKEVSYVRPKVLVLLGAAACRHVLGKEFTATTRAMIWDSSECARAFTFSAGGLIATDADSGEQHWANAKSLFKVVVGPSPLEAATNQSMARDLAKTFATASKLAAGHIGPANLDYMYAHTEQDAFKMLSELAKRCELEKRMAFDIETSGLVWYQLMHESYKADILSIGFAFRQAEAYALTLRKKHRSDRVVDALRRVLEHPISKTGHNGKFDNIFVRSEMGILVRNYDFDSFVAAGVLDQSSKSNGLDDQAAPMRPDMGRWWEKVEKHLDKKTGYTNCPDDVLLEYNAGDADASLTLAEDRAPRLERAGKGRLFHEIVMPHYNEMSEIEFFGVRMDVPGAKSLGGSMLKKIFEMEESCLAKVGRHPEWWGPKELQARGIAASDFRPFNLSSAPQLGDLIYKELKAPVTIVSEKTKAPSVSLDALEPLKKQHPFIAELLAYRKDQKFLSSFIGWEARQRPKQSASLELFGEPEFEAEGVKMDGTGMLACVGADSRLHANFHILGTETGRISITEPALQTIPKTKTLRNLIIPADGYVFVDADFKALELRILAMLSGDVEFIRVFREGLDPHSITASRMFNIPIDLSPTATKAERDAYFKVWNEKYKDQRKKAKAVNFGIPYGKGAEGLADELNVPVPEAQRYLDDWAHKSFVQAAKWLDRTVAESRKTLGVAYSMGRFRPLPGFSSPRQGEQNGAERQAKNTPIQGTGGDCTSLSVVRIHRRFRKELGPNWSDTARIVLEVHDQIVSEVRRERAEEVMGWVVEEMSERMPFLPDTIPLEVDADIKERWGD